MSDDFMQKVHLDREVEEATLRLHKETEKAILVSDDDNIKNAVWLPKSQIEFTKLPDGYVCCDIPEWLLQEKGLA